MALQRRIVILIADVPQLDHRVVAATRQTRGVFRVNAERIDGG